MSKLPYLNLGCGATFHNEWTNIDFVSVSPEVKQYNLLKGIPCNNETFEVVYHSHVLEHFPKKQAVEFIRECYRVLKPGGIIRIAIPDLEKIILNYVKYLDESMKNIPGAKEKYEWTMLELFDQVVRTSSGGEMLEYIKDTSKKNDDFLLERNGYEVKRIMEMFRNETNTASKPVYSFGARLKSIPARIKNKMVHILLGKDYAVLQTAKFRSGGEIHQWMYDRYSLKKMLEDCGFKNPEVKQAFESNIPEWEKYNLDGKDGIIRKPDSLFMEATK